MHGTINWDTRPSVVGGQTPTTALARAHWENTNMGRKIILEKK